MFFISVTKSRVANNFRSFNVQEVQINNSIVTAITDKFMSRIISSSNGFSVIESLPIHLSDSGDVIFSRAEYDKNSNSIDIFKATISGRPIYYNIDSEGNFFCSTHISMLRKAGVVIQENTEVLPEFFAYRYVVPPRTLYKNINQLQIGGHLQIDLSEERCKISRIDEYIPPVPDRSISDIDEISSRLIEILSETFRALSAYKDRISVSLSGGLDSSILYKVCENTFGIRSTFSAAYPFDGPNDRIEGNIEKKYAFSAAAAFDADHKYYRSTIEGYISGFIKAIASAEEPFELPQSPLLYMTFKEGIPEAKDVLILGQGADSIAGLNNFYFHQSVNARYERLKGGLGDKADKFIFQRHRQGDDLLSKNDFLKLMENASHKIACEKKPTLDVINYLNSIYLPLADPDNPVWSIGANGSEKWICDYFNVTKDKIIEGRYSVVSKFESRSIDEIMSILTLFSEGPVTQAVWSKMGESNYKITYYPYYSLDLLDFIYSIPLDIKIENPKNVLRNVARKLGIPEFIITRPKSGFGVSPEYWLEKGGIFESLVKLSSRVFDEDQIRYMRTDTDRKENIFKKMTCWGILNYSIWKRLFINNESLESLLGELNEAIEANNSTFSK